MILNFAQTGLLAKQYYYRQGGGALPTIFVSQSGSSGDGTEENPYSPAEFETALATMDAGERVGFKRGDTFEMGELSVPQNGMSFKAYGSGADPIILGSTSLSAATWTSETGGYYSTPLASAPKWVFKDGVAARYGESDWIAITSAPSSTSRGADTATLNAFNSVQSLVGAKMRVKEYKWRISYEHNISAYNDSTGVITTTETFVGAAVNQPFRLSGQKQFATLEGDWWWDSANGKLWIKTSSTPSGTDIRVTYLDEAFSIDTKTGTTFSGLEFKHYYRTAIDVKHGSNTTITNCLINHIRTNGLWIYGNSTGITVSNTEITRCGLNGVFMGAINTSNFTDLDIHDIGEESNHGWPLDTQFRKHSGVGISVTDESGEANTIPSNITVSGCDLYNLGYQGIGPYGSNWLIENCHIYNYSRKLDDAGGIHTFWSSALGGTETTGTIQNCIIHDGIGNGDGIASYNASEKVVAGIYIDNGSNGWVIDNVTVYNNPYAGVFCNFNSEETTLTDSLISGNGGTSGRQIIMVETPDVTNSPTYLNNYKNIITGNTIVCNEEGQVAIVSLSNGSGADANYNPFSNGGSCDNNYFVKPYKISGSKLFGHSTTSYYTYTNLTFAQWQSRNSVDASSTLKGFYLDQITNDALDAIALHTNTTNSEVIEDLTDGYYTDAASADVNSLTIPAYSGRVAFIKSSYYHLMDGFTAANGTSISGRAPTIGNTPSIISGTHTIQSNRMSSSGSDGLVLWGVGTPNYVFEADFIVTGTTAGLRVDLRYVDTIPSTTTRLIFDHVDASDIIRLRDFVGGAVANTWTAAYVMTTGTKRVKIIMNSGSVKVYIDSVLYIDETTTVTTGNYLAVLGQLTQQTIDNITVYPL